MSDGEQALTADEELHRPRAEPPAAERKRAADIYEAKLNVKRRVPYVRKSGAVKGFGTRADKVQYTYASESDLLARLTPALVDEEIVYAPKEIEVIDQGSYPVGHQGTEMQRVRVKVRWVFRHVPSGTEDDCWVLAEGGDVGDKCSGKANTISHKYALRMWLGIETGDDPDRNASEGGKRLSEAALAARQSLTDAKTPETLKAAGEAIRNRSFSPEEHDVLRQAFLARAREVGLDLKKPRRQNAANGEPRAPVSSEEPPR